LLEEEEEQDIRKALPVPRAAKKPNAPRVITLSEYIIRLVRTATSYMMTGMRFLTMLFVKSPLSLKSRVVGVAHAAQSFKSPR